MLSNDDILDQVRAYSTVESPADTDVQPYDYSWVEGFKERNDVKTLVKSSPSTSPDSAHSRHSMDDDAEEMASQPGLQNYRKPPLKRQRTPKRKRDLSRHSANGHPLPIPAAMTPPSTLVTNHISAHPIQYLALAQSQSITIRPILARYRKPEMLHRHQLLRRGRPCPTRSGVKYVYTLLRIPMQSRQRLVVRVISAPMKDNANPVIDKFNVERRYGFHIACCLSPSVN